MKSFIITLEGNKLSEKLSSECIVQAKTFGIDVVPYKAILGKDKKYHMDLNNFKVNTNTKKVMKEGHFGCFFSHYYLWEKCHILNEPLIILEHDGYFIRPLPDDVLNQFEDVLKLDYLDPYNKDYDKTISNNIDNSIEYIRDIKNITTQRAWGWYTWGAWAYILKPSGARKLIEFCKQEGICTTDNLLADGILNVVLSKPTIARLHPFFNGTNITKFTTIK